MRQALIIHHDLGDVVLKPSSKINQVRLRKMICTTLDQYLDEECIPAKIIHAEARQRHGDAYRTPGYYLRLYRHRADLTQAKLAKQSGIRQHHVSEIENNKRMLGKTNAKKLAGILDCDYRNLL